MANPNMREMARLSRVDYSEITSLDQINRREKSRFVGGYPGSGTPEWWALRLRMEEIMAKEQRTSGVKWTPYELERADNAKWTALGNEDAKVAFERDGETRDWWLMHWNPEALDGRRGIPSNLLKPIP